MLDDKKKLQLKDLGFHKYELQNYEICALKSEIKIHVQIDRRQLSVVIL